MTHLHTHVGPPPTARRQDRILLTVLVSPFAVATVVGLLVLWPADRSVDVPAAIDPQPERAEAVLVRVTRAPCSGTSDDPRAPLCSSATASIRTGPHRGDTIDLQEIGADSYGSRAEPGDRVVVARADGDEPGAGWYFEDSARRRSMVLLAVVFAAAIALLVGDVDATPVDVTGPGRARGHSPTRRLEIPLTAPATGVRRVQPRPRPGSLWKFIFEMSVINITTAV